MSRTVRGKKPCGYEYWGRRPCKLLYRDAGPYTKKMTHRAERKAGKKEAQHG